MPAGSAPKISGVTVGPFQENCYLVVDEASGRAALVDPGDEGARIVRMVQDASVTLEAVWLTHAHIDHIGGVAAVKRAWDVPVFLHPADRPLYDNGARQAAAYGLPFDVPPSFDRELAEGDVLELGALRFSVMHTPGHAPGLCVFHGHGVVLAGDLLFAGSIGRTDLPLSDPRAMQHSLERVVAELPEEAVVYPGHGPLTTLAEERRSNPFLSGAARVLGAW
jgi:hydroxyacylglutathione hydrolase